MLMQESRPEHQGTKRHWTEMSHKTRQVAELNFVFLHVNVVVF